MEPISFPTFQAINLPLGSQSSNHSINNDNSNHHHHIIDLTSDDQNQLTNLPSTSSNQLDRHLNLNQHDHDDDIIFTGESQPRTTQASTNHHISSNHSTIINNNHHPLSSHPNLSDQMATLTADIYAGYYSRNSTTNQIPQQSSSNLTIRDSPPPQVRRSNQRPINFGGGGRFSGGRFSGFLAAGLNGLRSFATVTNHSRYQQGSSLQEILSNWNRASDYNARFDEDRESSTFMSTQFTLGSLLSLSPHQMFSTLYEFDDQPTQSRESLQSAYKEHDSHPFKIQAGFSKEIIPLDREVLSIDSDTNSTRPQVEKQELRPICASCEEDLLMGQDSNLTAGSSGGRRPWILACGHVVDSKCLEQAKTRAREMKVEAQSRKTAKLTQKASSSPRGRPPKNSTSSTSKADTSKALNPKRRKLTLSSTSASSTCKSHLNIAGSSSSSSSDLAFKRKERADAREARKSIDFSAAKPLTGSADSLQPQGAGDETSLDKTLATNRLTSLKSNSQGKRKATAEINPSHNPAQSLTVSPVPLTTEEKPSKITKLLNLDSGTTNRGDESKTKTSLKAVKKLSADVNPQWIKCPVKGCKGSKGNLLAPPGSKLAPWEMYV